MSNGGFALLGVGVMAFGLVQMTAQSPAAGEIKPVVSGGTAFLTPWGAPDLQGIWDDQVVTSFERPKEFGAREFLTEKELAAQKYNAIRQGASVTQVGKRTSVVIDPPDGHIPPLTPEATKRLAAYREYQLALLQATDTCKRQLRACRDGRYGPISPRRAEFPPVYSLDRLNRADGPEDRSAQERCLGSQLPQIGMLQRIVQSPDAISIFYDDIDQGQGFSRVVPINTTPHLPSTIRQHYGDARGHWEGDTLVVDVTNFTNETEFRGSRESLHLIERYRRTDANTLEYQVTTDDPATWTKPWTAIVDLAMQDERANQIYQQTCHEGNYGLTGMLANTRAAETAFAEGRGPDPALQDNASCGDRED
jgi:hypothetical protein